MIDELIPGTSLSFKDSRKVLNFDEMMNLCDSTDNFDYVDEEVYGVTTRTFNYRLDIFSSFAQVGGRNFRGTCFELNSKKLLALPFFKFFNYNQSAFTLDTNVKKWNLINIFEKVDGSLVYFYKVNDNLLCRTKRTCRNLQCIHSMELVNKNSELKKYINYVIDLGYTPMFEFISPLNELIVKYNFETLCFLALRNRTTGKVYFADSTEVPIYKSDKLQTYPIVDNIYSLQDTINECTRYKGRYYVLKLLKHFKNNKIVKRIIDYIQEKNRNGVREGYVLSFDNGEIVKIKRLTYISLFKIREAINSDVSIVELLFNETLDDVIGEFKDNEIVLKYIEMIIECVNDTWNKTLKDAKRFYESHKDMLQKDYALTAMKELSKDAFTLAMLYYKYNGDISLDKVKQSYISNRKWRQSSLYTGEFHKDEGID